MKASTYSRLAALLGAAAIAAGWSALPASAQATRVLAFYVPGNMGIPQPEPLITLKAEKRSLARVLSEMFKQTPYQYQVRARSGKTLVFDLDVNKVPLSKALAMLLAQDQELEPLVFSFERSLAGGGTFLIDREYIDIGTFEGENRVSVAHGRLTKVLPRVFELMKAKYRIEPDVPAVTMSLQLRPSDWPEVLPQVIVGASKTEPALTYSIDRDTYVVHLQKTPNGMNGLPVPDTARRVKMSVANAPLSQVLAELFRGSQWKYELSPQVNAATVVSYNTGSAAELAALAEVLRQAGARAGKPVTYREGKGVLYIEPGALPGEAQLAIAQAATGNRRTSSYNALQRRLKTVASDLSGSYGTTIMVAPNVPDLPLTFRVEGVTVDKALDALVAAGRTSIPNLSVRATDNGYLLELR